MVAFRPESSSFSFSFFVSVFLSLLVWFFCLLMNYTVVLFCYQKPGSACNAYCLNHTWRVRQAFLLFMNWFGHNEHRLRKQEEQEIMERSRPVCCQGPSVVRDSTSDGRVYIFIVPTVWSSLVMEGFVQEHFLHKMDFQLCFFFFVCVVPQLQGGVILLIIPVSLKPTRWAYFYIFCREFCTNR